MTHTVDRPVSAINARDQMMTPLIIGLVWLIVGFWGWLWLGQTWFAAMRPAPHRMTDFYQDWGSARNYVVGLPVYTDHVTSIPRHLGIAADPANHINYNAHPPPAVLLVLPLAMLTYPDAVLVWNIISLLSLVVSLMIVAHEMELPATVLPPTIALLVVCHPNYGNLYLGQLTLVLLMLITMTWALERSGRSKMAGALIGGAAAVKLFPAYLVVFYLAQRRLSAIGPAGLSFVIVTFVTASVLGLDCYHDYLSIVVPEQAKFWSCGYNLSVAGFWHKLFDPVIEAGFVTPLYGSPALARWGTLISNLLITAIVVRSAYRARTPCQRDLAFGLTITAMLLVSPVAWDFSLPLLLVPLVLIAGSQQTAKYRWIPLALVLILTIIWVPQNILTEIAQAGRPMTGFSWAFMLGAPSMKFYSLVATFLLGLATLQLEK